MKKIVIYQHDDAIRGIAAIALREAGFCVYAAETATKALSAALALKPDLIITDFPALLGPSDLPHATLSEAIRAHPELSSTRLINLATSAFPHLHDHAIRAGVDASMRTPPDTRQVVNHVARLVV